MWIELTKEVDGHPVGKFIEAEESVARAYIAAGFAKDGGDGPDVVLLQRSIDTFRGELKGFVDGTAKAITDATQHLAKRPVVRGNGVEFDTLENGASEADKSKSIGDFFGCVSRSIQGAAQGDLESSREAHDRLTKVYQVKRNMTEGQGSSLGYTTPVIYESMIYKVAAEQQVFLKNAKRVPLGARQVEWPALDQYKVPTAGQSAMFGGVQVYRKGENVQRTQSNVATKKVVMVAQDMTCFFELSRDLLQDSTATLDALIPELGGNAIGWRCDWEAWQGTGAGQMLGIINAPATIFVTRSVGSHISYADVFPMYTRLLPSCKATSAWYVHPFAMSDIMQLKDSSGRNVYLPVIPGNANGPIGQPISGYLLGRPIIESEKMFPLGTQGDLMLASMPEYLYGERSGLEVGISEHFLFDTDQIAIRLKIRNDGKPALKAPIYLADGSGTNQVSAFVVLQ